MKIKRALAALLALLCLTTAALGAADGGDIQFNGTIKGGTGATSGSLTIRVVEEASVPVPGVSVAVSVKGGGGISGSPQITDGNGEVVFSDVVYGQRYTVTLTKDGYGTATYEIGPFSGGGKQIFLIQKNSGGGDSGGGTGGDSGDRDPKPKPTPTPVPTVTPKPTPTPPPATPPVTPGPTATPGLETPKPTAGTETPAPTAAPGLETPKPTAGTETPKPSAKPGTPSPRPSAGAESPQPSAETETPPPSAGTDPQQSTPPVESAKPPREPIVVTVPEDRVQIPPQSVEASVQEERQLVVDFVDEDGAVVDTVRLAPFDPHDQELIRDSEVWVERREGDRPVIQLVKEPVEITTDASIPHNIIQAARERQADIRVSFRAPTGEVYDFDALFPAGFFDGEIYDEQDTTMEYDAEAEQGWLIISNQASVHRSDTLTVAKAAYEKASADGWGIKTRVYNPEDGGDLWYEWVFAPKDLERVARAMTDTDLFITPERDMGADLLDRVDTLRNRAQYFVIPNFHGELPVPATLRVKNMAGFDSGDSVDLLYANEETGALETVLEGLSVGEDGYLTYGAEHCSSYALTAPIPLWWLWYAVVGGLFLLLFLILLLLWRRKPDELAWLVLFTCDATAGQNVRRTEVWLLSAVDQFNAALDDRALTFQDQDVKKRLDFWVRRGCVSVREDGGQRTFAITDKGTKRLEDMDETAMFGEATPKK